jgi:Tfp pilus assembly protein PilN
MRAVNLLPENTSSRRIGMPSGMAVAGAAATVAAVGAVVVLAHGESVTVASRQAHVDDLQQQLARVPAPKTATNASGAAILTSRDSRTAAVEAALNGRVPWDVLLNQVARVLPDGTWLDSMQLAAPGASTTPGVAPAAATPGTPSASGIVITGYTANAASLALVLQRLTAVPSLTDVKLQPSQISVVGKKTMFKFAIGANVAGGGS